jgi:hypothetical protein
MMVKKKISAGGYNIQTYAYKIISNLNEMFKNEEIKLKIALIITYLVPIIFIILGIISLIIIMMPKSQVVFYYDYYHEITRCHKSLINYFVCNPVISFYAFLGIILTYAVIMAYLAYLILYNMHLSNQEVKYMFYLQVIMLVVYILIYVIIYHGVYNNFVYDLGSSKYRFHEACQNYMNYEYINNLTAVNTDIVQANTENFLNSYVKIQLDLLQKQENINVNDVSRLSPKSFNSQQTDHLYTKIRNAYITYSILETFKSTAYQDHSGVSINAAFFNDPNGLIMSVNKSTNKLINDNIINGILDTKSELYADITTCINDLHMHVLKITYTFDKISLSPAAIYWYVMLPVSVIHLCIILVALYYA